MKELLNKTVTKIEINGEEDVILFHTENEIYKMYSEESAKIEYVNGNLNNLIDIKLVKADKKIKKGKTTDGNYTLTFFTFSTANGIVGIKWSNKSISTNLQEVMFKKISKDDLKEVCSNSHDEIIHYSLKCPLCEANKKIAEQKAEIDYLGNKKSELEERIDYMEREDEWN